jgi:hypothetical protein
LQVRSGRSSGDETKVAFVGSIAARKFRRSEGAGGFFDKHRCKGTGARSDGVPVQYLRE